MHKQNYFELSDELGFHRNTIQKYVTWTPCITGELPTFLGDTRFGVIIDATYLRDRSDGFALIRTDTGYNLNYAFISSESLSSMSTLLDQFTASGYHLHTTSFTIDGRRFMFKLLQEKYGNIPIQMCLFHMKSIIRRYITMRPKTRLWKALMILKACLGLVNEKMFLKLFHQIEIIYAEFLLERNEKGKFEHKKLRTVMGSIRYYLPYLYTYEHYLVLKISRTTGECDWYFAHIKDRLWVHRWLKEKNRNNCIIFLLEEKNRMLKNTD